MKESMEINAIREEEAKLVTGGSTEVYVQTADRINEYLRQCERERVTRDEFTRRAKEMVSETRGLEANEISDLLVLINVWSQSLRR